VSQMSRMSQFCLFNRVEEKKIHSPAVCALIAWKYKRAALGHLGHLGHSLPVPDGPQPFRKAAVPARWQGSWVGMRSPSIAMLFDTSLQHDSGISSEFTK
jgi:hypothetical protein